MGKNIHLEPVSDQQRWTELFRQCSRVDFMQTWQYGLAIHQSIQWEPSRQVVLLDNAPIALAQTLVKNVPTIGTIARIQHGPLFFTSEKKVLDEHTKMAIDALWTYWVEQRGMSLHVTPCVLPDDLPENWYASTRLAPSREVLWASVRIDLRNQPQRLREQMKRKWRYSLRKAEEMELTLEMGMNESDLRYFLDRYRQTSSEKGITWPSPDLIHALWRLGDADMKLIFAQKNGERIGAMVLFPYADSVVGLVAWNGPLAPQYHAHNFLIWQSVLLCQKLGFRWFDLGGIDEVNLPGITQFKLGFGGETYQYIGNYEAKPGALHQQTHGAVDFQTYDSFIPGLHLSLENTSGNDTIMAEVEKIVRDLVRQTTGWDGEFDARFSLINSGLIDSLSMVSVIQELIRKFDIDIQPQEITIDNFDTVEAIGHLVTTKIAQN
ncbi:MAG: peptidoglycan bridge formation glycyltransferase FemA/FemB family protein [Candidatus Zhuqueibacterota bacterium]